MQPETSCGQGTGWSPLPFRGQEKPHKKGKDILSTAGMDFGPGYGYGASRRRKPE